MKIFRDYATKVAVIYAVMGLCWIFFSDSILILIAPDISILTEIASWKGAAFVLVSSFVIYLISLERNKSEKQDTQIGIGKTPPVLVFAAVATIIVFIGIAGASYIAHNEKQKSINQLTTVAHLKADELQRWLNERIGDAEFMRSATFFIKPQGDWKKRTDEETKKKVIVRLEDLRRASDYHCVFLADEDGDTLLSSAKHIDEVTPILKQAIKKALQTNQTTLTDIYSITHDGDKAFFIDFITPTKAPKGVAKTVVVARVDAKKFLYPYLQSWPISSSSAETLLFEQDSDNVLFLNELRHRKNTALELKISIKQKNLLAAQALDKDAKLKQPIEGVDYRGVPTIGVAQKIEGTNWFLMSKQDKSEIYAEAKNAALWIGIVDALTIVIAASTILVFHQRRELQLIRMRHKEQAEKLQALQLLNAISEASIDAIFAKDVEGRYILANKQTCIYFDKRPEDIIGHYDNKLFQVQDGEVIRADDRDVISSKTTKTYEEQLTTAIGVKTFLATKGPLLDANGNVYGVFGLSRDITERRIAQDQITELNRTLEQKVAERTIELKNAYDEMEAFTYSVSHDLRSPLRATDGFSQAVLEDYYDKLDEQGKDYLLRIRHASQKMESLIDDLLKLSRLTRHEISCKEIDLSQLADKIIKELVKERTDVEIQIQENMMEYADSNLMQIALTNLFSNALKFTSKQQEAQISFGFTQQNGEKIYYIKDNGAGFDMAYSQHLFKPFHRLHTAQEFDGSGIGLAIVYRIITRHFGKIWAQGESGKGASFFFTLNAK